MARYSTGNGRVRADGVKQLDEKLARLARDMPLAAAAGIEDGMCQIMVHAKQRTPVDTGAMQASGYVAAPEISGGKARVDAGFGGPSRLYVRKQHENEWYNHPNGGEDHFFSKAIDAGRDLLRNTVRKAISYFTRTGRPLWNRDSSIPKDPWSGTGGS